MAQGGWKGIWGGLASVGRAFVTPMSGLIVLCILFEQAFSNILSTELIHISGEARVTFASTCLIASLVFGATIVLLAIFAPGNLIYDKEARLRDRGKAPFGTERRQGRRSEAVESPNPV